MGKDVIYKDQVLTLTRFWGNNEACLWIKNPEQIHMSKMEFVGGYPDEYCIFIKNLSEKERTQITSMDGTTLNIEKELVNLE